MKVKCIKIKKKIKGKYYYADFITKGKIYDVISSYRDESYFIYNDENRLQIYPKYWFIDLIEYRNDKINKILDL